MKAQVEDALRQIMGLKLSGAWHAGMRGCGFGPLHLVGNRMRHEYSLHLQCPWRITCENELFTGSGDWYSRIDEGDSNTVAWEEWDPVRGGSLQEAKLKQLFGAGESEARPLINMTEDLIVTGLTADAVGSFTLYLSPNYVLSVFPVVSSGEHWRLFRPGSDVHFVMETENPGICEG